MAGTYERSIEWRRALAARNAVTARKYPVGFDTSSRLYRIWRAMYIRCNQRSHAAYPRYGGCGIGICRGWQTYAGFMAWALPAGYRDGLEIDRFPDQKGNYEPGNCRWVTRSQNARNRSDNIAPVIAFGETKTPLEWTEDPRYVVSYRLLLKRLHAGWSAENALSVMSQPLRGERLYSARQRQGYRDPARAR